MKKRVITIFGARPQFIKAAVLSREIQNYENIEEILVHTGQHFDKNMSDIFFEELELPKPKHFLDINSCSHGQITGKMLSEIEGVLLQEKSDMVLVYGDTNSTLAGALAASKLHIPVVHVEAGLRSFNKKMPEEINRVLTDHLSSFLFCPTMQAVKNLGMEGITVGVYHVGDIMYDATILAKDYIKKNQDKFNKSLMLDNVDFALMTIHREESTINQKNFSKFLCYANEFSKKNNVKILFIIHPRNRRFVKEYKENSNFYLMNPISYFETQFLLSKASFVITDSGGLQKEAYFHKVPCITLRSETEWVETIENGWNRLWTDNNYNLQKTIKDYGDGFCAKKIIDILINNLK